MSDHARQFAVSAGLVLTFAGNVAAQTASPSSATGNGGWRFTVYPLLAHVPTSISIDLNLPSIDGGGSGGSGGGSGSGSQRAEIIDPRRDGALLAGFAATNGTWRIDADGMWASVGGDRPDSPTLSVDTDVIYGHVSGGRAIFKDFFVTAGVRRFALKYDITIGDNVARLSRKPGIWDPLIGVGYHREGEKLEVHGVFEGGGFGVGADSDVSGSFRVDLKPVRHFGVTAGYSFLKFKVSHEVLGKTLIARQTLHGPTVGIGIYF